MCLSPKQTNGAELIAQGSGSRRVPCGLFTSWCFLAVASQMGKAQVGATKANQGVARLRPALEKLEQWLVGFPCRVLIRYMPRNAACGDVKRDVFRLNGPMRVARSC